MERDEMEALAKANDVPFNARTSDEVLARRLQEKSLGTSEPASVQSSAVEVKVLVGNLWTSAGKFFAKDVVTLPADEAKALEDDDKVVIK